MEKIEKLREDMHVLARIWGISSPEVLGISRQIDHALNEYGKLTGAHNVHEKATELK